MEPIVNNIEESWHNGYLRGIKDAESEKIDAVKKVILKRKEVLDKARKMNSDPLQRSWYDGRLTGLMDVYDLLNSSVESIEVELEEPR